MQAPCCLSNFNFQVHTCFFGSLVWEKTRVLPSFSALQPSLFVSLYPATLFSYSICYYLFCAARLDDTIFVLCLTCYPFYQLGILGGLYSGGSAQMVEKSLDIHGDEILYVGDHIYTDVSQSKVHLRWRTALICRELEDEVCLLTFSHYFCSRYFSYHIIYF